MDILNEKSPPPAKRLKNNRTLGFRAILFKMLRASSLGGGGGKDEADFQKSKGYVKEPKLLQTGISRKMNSKILP